MSTTIDDVTGDSDAGDSPVATPGHARRSVWGRLYHGETSIDFYGRRWWGLIGSGILLVITVISLFVSGLNLGIDFEGGVAWEVPSATVTSDQIVQVLQSDGVDTNNAKIQTLTSESGTRIRVQVGDQDQAIVTKVQTELAALAKVGVDEIPSTSVSSSWGRSITEKAVRALVIFLVLVALFISWRFEWRMALSAIIAMLHDVFISVGVYSVLGFEVTPATVVAFLTILGFSLYDTIVVFDKVKDNEDRYIGVRAPYADTINVSMNQVLMRSLNTSLSAVLPVLSLLVLGSGVFGAIALREFALALLVGLITGSYSSIFIASPLLAFLKERAPRYRSQRGQHSTGIELERLVLGGTPSGRTRSRTHVATSAIVGALVAPTVQTPESALTHPPRPRKKKRR